MDVPDPWLAPTELRQAVEEFFPDDQVDNALRVAFLESNWNAFAEADTRTALAKCGETLRWDHGIRITAEWSIGWFQINACNLPPSWDPRHLFNTRHNVGTAHDYWSRRGWAPWYYSATRLGLL